MDQWVICIAPQLFYQGYNLDGVGHLAGHKVADAMRFSSKLDALEYIRVNGLTQSARPVLLPAVENR